MLFELKLHTGSEEDGNSDVEQGRSLAGASIVTNSSLSTSPLVDTLAAAGGFPCLAAVDHL